MDYRIFDKTAVLRLDRGDEVITCIKELCEKENIRLASVTGIGGTDDFTVGVFNLDKKCYDLDTFRGAYEITGINGNINTYNGKHYSHIHVNCSNKGGKTVGGHLIKCVISLTAEIIINIIDGDVDRYRDESLQINKLKFFER